MDMSLGKTWEAAGSRVEFSDDEENDDARTLSPPPPLPTQEHASPERKRRRAAVGTPIQKLQMQLRQGASAAAAAAAIDEEDTDESLSSPGCSPQKDGAAAKDSEIEDWISSPFVNIDSQGKMFISGEAVAMLSKHRRPLAVMCITGPARTGKSSAINTIIGGRTPRELRNPRCGARVGDTTNPCTEGVHSMPIQSAEALWRRLNVEDRGGGDSDFDILILDSEGTEALNRQAHYNTNLLTLLFLISSTFVYNTKGSIDEAALEKLTTVVQAARRVMSKNGGGGDPSSSSQGSGDFSLPAFLWLVRDFMLVLEDAEGAAMSSDQYLDSALKITPGMAKDRAMLRRDFARFFRSRGCCTIAPPHSRPKIIQQMSTVDPSVLTAEFRRDVERVRGVIPFAVRPRVICGTPITGESLLHVLQIFVAALNKGEVPEVKSSWMQVAEARCQDIVDEGLDQIREEMRAARRDPIDSVSAVRAIRDATVAKIREQGLDSVAPQKSIDVLNASATVARGKIVDAWMQKVCSNLPHPPPMSNLFGEEGADDAAAGPRKRIERWVAEFRAVVRAAVWSESGAGAGAGVAVAVGGAGETPDVLTDAVLGRSLGDALPEILCRASEEGELTPPDLLKKGGASEEELEEARVDLAKCRDDLAKSRAQAETERERHEAELEAAARETRRLASERERQGENLSRLESELEVMSELQARAAIMEEEMQRVRKDAAIAEERAERDISTLQGSLATASAELAESRRGIEACRRKAKEDLEAAAGARDKLTRELEIYKAECTTRIGMLTSERDRYREETERSRQALVAEKRRSESASELSRIEIRKERDANRDLSEKLHESEMRVARAEMAAQKLAITLEEMQRKDEEIGDLKEEAARMREKVSRLTGENRAQKDARERLAEEIRVAKEEIASLKAEQRQRTNRTTS
jgi:hypothetical protein